MNCPINCPPRALRVPSCGQYRVLLEINTSPPWEHTHSSSVFPPLSNNLYRIYLLPLLWKFTRGKTLRVTFRSIRRFKCSRLSRVAGSQHAKLLSRIYALLNFRSILFDGFSHCFGILYAWICIFLLSFFVFKLEIVFVRKSRVWKWKYEMKLFTRL